MSSQPNLLTLLLLVSMPIIADHGGLATTVAPNLYEFAHPSGGLIYRLDPVTGDPVRFAYRDRYRVFETATEGICVYRKQSSASRLPSIAPRSPTSRAPRLP